MVSEAKPWLVSGYHSLTMVAMVFFYFICGKTMVIIIIFFINSISYHKDWIHKIAL